MEIKILERVEALLKEEGFAHISKHSSAHSATLSADKGAERFVLHLTDREEQPYRIGMNPDVPAASDIRATATLLGVRPNLEGQLVQRTGQSGVLRRPKRR
jgi:hypothetical protein